VSGCGWCGLETGARPYSRKRDLPSVTTVTGLIDGGKSRSFGWAAAGIAATTAVHRAEEWINLGTEGCTHDKTGFCPACRYIRSRFDEEWRTKANLGTHVHHLALSWASGEPADVDDASAPYMDALEAFYTDCQPNFELLEATVVYDQPRSHGYRGQFDFIATLTRSGERRRMLVDIKTGSFHPVEQTLQLAAYRGAQHLTDWSSGSEVKTGRMPPVAEAGVLLLQPDGNYRLIDLPANGDAHAVFLRLVDAHRWTRDITKWAKALDTDTTNGEAA
jgi:hypothetical protein